MLEAPSRCQVCGEPLRDGDWWRAGQIGADDGFYARCSHYPDTLYPLSDDGSGQ